jgi:transposase
LICRFVERLDLAPLRAVYRGVGSDAYPPDLMLKMTLYQVYRGRPSPAQWAQDCSTDFAMLWLGHGIQPSRSVCYAYRTRLGVVLENLNDAVIRQAIAEGLIDGRCGVIDGTAIRSQGSRHRLQNRERLQRRREALDQAIARDQAGTSGDPFPGWIARTPRGRLQQAKRYAAAADVLERRVTENARKPKDRRLEERHVMVSVSDPEAALGRDKEKVFAPLFTVSNVVDQKSLIILAQQVFPQATDAGTLAPMLDRVRQVVGRPVKEIVGDAGFVSVSNLRACAERRVTLYGPIQENDVSGKRKASQKCLPKTHFTWEVSTQTYLCPQGQRLPFSRSQRKARSGGEIAELRVYQCPAEHCRVCPLKSECTRNPEKGRTITRQEGEELLEEHRRRMETPKGKRLRRNRGSVIERSFGDAKAHRQFRRFHGRGLNNAKAESGLMMMVFNAMAWERLETAAASPAKSPA